MSRGVARLRRLAARFGRGGGGHAVGPPTGDAPVAADGGGRTAPVAPITAGPAAPVGAGAGGPVAPPAAGAGVPEAAVTAPAGEPTADTAPMAGGSAAPVGGAVAPLTPEERDRFIGVGMAALLVRMNTAEKRDGWVNIRVERLSLVDVTTVRRETTIDFTYPVGLRPVAHMLDLAPALVPLTLLTKGERLAGFSVRDEADAHLPVLTRIQSADEAARCLVALARTQARTRGIPLAPAVVEAFRKVAALPGAEAGDLLGRMRLRAARAAARHGVAAPFGPGWDAFLPTRSPTEAVALADAALAGSDDADLLKLFELETLNLLARSLATQFLLLTPLPAQRIAERRVVVLGYDEEYLAPAGRSLPARLRAGLGAGLGWRSTVYELEAPSVGRAQRYQAEVTVPPTLQVVFAELRVVQPVVTPVAAPPVPPPHTAPVPRALRAAWSALRGGGYAAPVPRTLWAAVRAVRRPERPRPQILRVPARASVFLVAMQPEVDVPAGSQAVVAVEFQASRVGLIRTAPLLGLFTAAVLFVGKARLSLISPSTTSTLLLVVPTLFAALLARPGEHALATRLLLGTRVLVMALGLATFVAAASLAGGWSLHVRHAVWDWAAWGAAAATVVLATGLALNWRRARRGSRGIGRGR